MITAPPKAESFRTEVARGLPATARVDMATRTVFGIKAIELGPLNAGDDRPWKVDEITLEQTRKLASAKGGGVKMRFAHPNMSRDGMGRHVGRAVNPRIATDNGAPYLAVDAKLNAVGGQRTTDMVAHILDLAQNAPEDFGVSLAPLVDHEAMRKMQPDENGLIPIRLKALNAIDFVDEPAATRGGLFDLHSEEIQDLPARATDLLDTFFATASPDVIRQRFGEFLDRYLKNRGADMSQEKPNSNLGTEEDIAALKAEIATLRAEVAAMKDEGEGEMEAEPEKKPEESPMSEGGGEPEKKKEDEAMSRKKTAADELRRIGQIEALCKLAGVPADRQKLMIDAGFSRGEAQDYLAKSGFLAAKNPPLGEIETTQASAETPEQKSGKEYDAQKDALSRLGLTREQYVKSRIKDAA